MLSQTFSPVALRPAECATLELRGLYERFGYKKYSVSQFEEYGLYLQYRSFLHGGRMLTFTDLDGRLLALKPDVTISIIKNARLEPGGVEKAYYIENVYRENKTAGTFKEIKQMGLEYLGKVDTYAVAETLMLAQETLRSIGPDWVLELSHMGFVLGMLKAMQLDEATRREMLVALAAKSRHGVHSIAKQAGLSEEQSLQIEALCTLSGRFEDIAEQAQALCICPEMQDALQVLKDTVSALEDTSHIRLDFTLQGDMDYYDGIMMCGYLEGVPGPVLTGGRYDSLVKKLGKDAGAVGFALYLDKLERLPCDTGDFDLDYLILPDADADTAELLLQVEKLVATGQRVRVDHIQPSDLRCKKICRFTKEGLSEC